MATAPPTDTVITLPAWVWGGSAARLLEEADLATTPDPTLGPDEYRVRTNEQGERGRPGLVTVRHLGGSSANGRGYEPVNTAEADSDLTLRFDDERRLVVQERLERAGDLAEKGSRSGFLAAGLSFLQLQSMLAEPAAAAATVEGVVENLRAIAYHDGEKVFPNAEAFLVRRRPALHRRASIPPILVRVTRDDRLRQHDLSHLQAANARGQAVFAASSNLGDGITLLDAYLAPLLGALTPYVWAFSVSRMSGTIIYTLGTPLAGTAGDAVEPLHLLPAQSSLTATDRPTLSTTASGAAVTWWTRRLDKMLSVVTDPAVFSDASGRYIPTHHQHALLSVDQLFRRVGAIQRAHRDTDARSVLLFTVLDTLERLTDRRLTEMCTLSVAQRTLERVRDAMSADVQQVLLPAAERAVSALRALQDGFYIQKQTGASTIDFELTDGTSESFSPERAAAEYVRVLRNATHGHGSDREHAIPRTDALLAHHDGTFDHELPLLGYLYLLELLTQPASLRRAFHARTKALAPSTNE